MLATPPTSATPAIWLEGKVLLVVRKLKEGEGRYEEW